VSAPERSGAYRVLRPLRFVVGGDWRATVQLSTGDMVERVLLADLPLEEALPLLDMLERDARAGRRAAGDVVFFRAAGQVRSAVYGQDVTVCR
jgi:hypothetical protein